MTKASSRVRGIWGARLAPGFENPDFKGPDFVDPELRDPSFDDPGFDDPGFDDPSFDDADLEDPWFETSGCNETLGYKNASACRVLGRQTGHDHCRARAEVTCCSLANPRVCSHSPILPRPALRCAARPACNCSAVSS